MAVDDIFPQIWVMFGNTLINSAKHVPILSEFNMIRVFNFSALPFRLSFRFAMDLKDILRCCTQTSCPCSVFVETVGGSSPKAATASSSKPDSQDFLRDKRARSLNGQKSVPRGQIYIYIYSWM